MGRESHHRRTILLGSLAFMKDKNKLFCFGMEFLGRTTLTLFGGSSFSNHFTLATYNDNISVSLEEKDEIVGILIGCDRIVTPEDAIELMNNRLKQDWTWRVVLKVMLIIHHVIQSPSTSVLWMTNFFVRFNIFDMTSSFREGELDDKQACQHAVVVRKYSLYLKCLVREMTRKDAFLTKSTYLGTYGEKVKCLEQDELFRAAHVLHAAFTSCCAVFFEDKKLTVPTGFCALTEGIALATYRDAVRHYAMLCTVLLELLSRTEEFDEAECKFLVQCVSQTELCTALAVEFSNFVRDLPSIDTRAVLDFERNPRETQEWIRQLVVSKGLSESATAPVDIINSHLLLSESNTATTAANHNKQPHITAGRATTIMTSKVSAAGQNSMTANTDDDTGNKSTSSRNSTLLYRGAASKETELVDLSNVSGSGNNSSPYASHTLNGDSNNYKINAADGSHHSGYSDKGHKDDSGGQYGHLIDNNIKVDEKGCGEQKDASSPATSDSKRFMLLDDDEDDDDD
eukprot:Lankesteria_metandrocarpae@DN566_c0_g1_i1.p1